MTTFYRDLNNSQSYNIVGGAAHNTINANVVGGTISGGGGSDDGSMVPNTISGSFGTIGGGSNNFAGIYSTIGGGSNNRTSFQYVSIGGGRNNHTSSLYTTISGGLNNDADGLGAAIGGGSNNEADGHYATIPGGSANLASGGYSFAAGRKAHALHSGSFVWADSNSSSGTVFSSTAENQFLIRAIGGVGIGTSSPSNQLSIFGNVDVSEKLVVGDPAPRAMVTVRGPDSSTNGPIIFMYGDGSDQVESGRIRFVEGTAPGNVRGAYIHYDGDANQLHIGTVNLAGGSANAITIRRENRNVGLGINPSSKLHVNGDALADSHTTPSDARLKKNITPLENALGILGALRGVRFDWRTDMGDLAGEGSDIGVIAQEVAAVVPEVVHETDSGYLTVDYAKLVPVLIEAIKAQQADLEYLRAAIERAGIK